MRPSARRSSVPADDVEADSRPAQRRAPPLCSRSASDQDGLYKLTYAESEQCWVEPRRPLIRAPSRSQTKGTEIPIIVQGEGDGRFDSADYHSLLRQRPSVTHTQRSMCTGCPPVQAPAVGCPYETAGPAKAPSQAHFPALVHAEEDTAYWQTMPSLTGEDRWFWGTRLSPNTQGMPTFRDYTVHLGSISACGNNCERAGPAEGLHGSRPSHRHPPQWARPSTTERGKARFSSTRRSATPHSLAERWRQHRPSGDPEHRGCGGSDPGQLDRDRILEPLLWQRTTN